jgi:hypothetical protein
MDAVNEPALWPAPRSAFCNSPAFRPPRRVVGQTLVPLFRIDVLKPPVYFSYNPGRTDMVRRCEHRRLAPRKEQNPMQLQLDVKTFISSKK